MNVGYSSAWLEYFADGLIAADFVSVIEDSTVLVVPTATFFEEMNSTACQSWR